MLQSIFYFLFISICCMAWGLPFLLYWQRGQKQTIIAGEEGIYCFFIGLSLLAIISSAVSLLLPVQSWLLLLLTMPLVMAEVVWVKKRGWKFAFSFLQLHLTEIIFITACLVLFFFLSSGKPAMEDTELYHIQSIQWIYQYGTVTGLADLYLRYGFYSNWFHLISFFYLPTAHQNFLYLNNTLCIWMLFFLFYQYKKFSLQSNRHLSLYYFLLIVYMLFEWNLFRAANSSTTYDFAVTCYCILSVHLIVNYILQKQSSLFPEYALLLFLAVVPFFKLTGFLVSLLAIPYFVISGFKQKQVLFFGAAFTAGLLIMICKNYLQTGYPLYPYNLFDLAKPSWQVPAAMVHRMEQTISLSNHYINQPVPAYLYTNKVQYSYWHNWYCHLTRPDQFIVALSVLCLPLSPVLNKSAFLDYHKKIGWLQFLSYCVLILWLIASPDPRFVYGFLLFTALFPLSIILSRFFKNWIFYTSWMLLTVCIGIYIKVTWKEKFTTSYLLHPPAIEQPPFKTVWINGTLYHIPERINHYWNRRCMNTPLPCIYEYNPYLQLRGKNYKEGFRMYPAPDSDFVIRYNY